MAAKLKGRRYTFVVAADTDEPQEDTVSEGQECPQCGERRMDRLVVREGGDSVRCETCGTIFEL